MQLDIRTLLLVIALLMLGRAAVLALVYRKQSRYTPAKYWALGSALLALGSLLVGLRTHVPLGLSVVGGQALVMTGWMLLDAGFVRAARRAFPLRTMGFVVVLAMSGVAWFLWGQDDYVFRTVCVSVPPIAFDLYAAYCAFNARGHADARKEVLRWAGVVLLLTALSNAWKLLYVVQVGQDVLFNGDALVNVQFYLWATVYCVATTGLCVLLAALRMEDLMDHALRERRRAEEKVRDIAYLDPLTRLPNRRLLEDRLAQAVSLARRTQSFGALMVLDLDNFKPLNDRYGHAAGDMLLQEASRRLQANLRAVDTAARIGGDEFVVVLSGLHIEEPLARLQAQAVAEKIRAALAAPYCLPAGEAGDDIEHSCSASIGVALFQGGHGRDIIKTADSAMYQAKESGRNRVCLGDSVA